MNIGITYRLFLSILAATCVALLCMFLIMQWSINRGFLQYLSEMEEGKLNQISGSLEAEYAENGSWDFLRDEPMQWIKNLLAEIHKDDVLSNRLNGSGKKGDVSTFPPSKGAHRSRVRFIVLDADKKTLWGNLSQAEDVRFKAIIHNNEIVGYVGLLPLKQFLHPRQEEFLKQQTSALIFAVFGMLIVVVIFSFPLAKHFVKPIKTIAAATHDLTSGKYAVRVPISSSDELGQLSRDFNAMALALEKNEKSRRQWVADISHELRTPLAVLRGEIEALLEGIRGTTPEAIRSLNAEVLRLHRLVEDLYQLALSDLGALNYHKEELVLSDVLMDSIEPHRQEFICQGIKFTTDISEGTKLFVFADRERLHQLFANLLDNSLKYTESGGEFVIRLLQQNDQAAIDFEDSAPGVPEEELKRIFDRLYRVEGSRSRTTGGAGLGLAICKNIVEAHAGTISVHPSPLGGVLIRVTIPVSGVFS